ncbi:MAG: 1-deoxy-D-xylulose-5-phosphate synthase [Firmicutes bacterium]|nr:1-deoxy-D-xylulose-5-phosphate synthase [Bacillota bacterium]
MEKGRESTSDLLLPKIRGPADLRRLDFEDLKRLAAEIREVIVATTSRTGGHLAPNLGVVELTLALHYVFDSPRDKIIWDVGHQSYVHKLLTGRYHRFGTLRQLGGISGFPRPEESVHDVFATGHSSTSVSAGLGLAVARDLAGRDFRVVAVIGDGALTAGMAFEALNHAGHLQKDLLVVLNDNEMSIAPNVGALAKYLNRLRTDPMYRRGKEEIERLLNRIPAIGPRVARVVERLKDGLKYLVVPGMFFEELGFAYLGPVDGHDIPLLVEVFRQARKARGPVLVHVLTKKGKGYPPAERNPDLFHGIGPFRADTGEPEAGRGPTYTEVFGRTVVELARRDPRVVAITAAMPAGTGLVPFAREFPERFFDVGIAEQHAVTLAAGMAKGGLRPVVAIYSTFLQRAYDQIIHDVCLQNLPVVFAVDRAGIVGDDGATHQGLFDLAFLRTVPNMVVMAPRDAAALANMLYTALELGRPAALRYPRRRAPGAPPPEWSPVPLGRAEVLREGDDAALVAIGTMVPVACGAAEVLAAQGIGVAVIDARFAKPLDEECLSAWAERTRLVVTLEEHVLAGGFGSAVAEMLADRGLSGVRVARMGLSDTFVEHGSQEALLARYGLTPEAVAREVARLLGRTGGDTCRS